MVMQLIIGLLVLPLLLSIILFDNGIGLGLHLDLSEAWIILPVVSSVLPIVIIFVFIWAQFRTGDPFEYQLSRIARMVVIILTGFSLALIGVLLYELEILYLTAALPFYLYLLIRLWSLKFESMAQLQLRRYLIVSLLWPIFSAFLLIIARLVASDIPLDLLSFNQLSFAFFFNSISIGFIPLVLQLRTYLEEDVNAAKIRDGNQIKIEEMVNLIYIVFLFSIGSFIIYSLIYFMTDQLMEEVVELDILRELGILAIPLGIYFTFVIIGTATKEQSGFSRAFRNTGKLIASGLSVILFLNIVVVFIFDVFYFLFFTNLALIYILVQLVVQAYRLPAKTEDERLLKNLYLTTIVGAFVIPVILTRLVAKVADLLFSGHQATYFLDNLVIMALPAIFILFLNKYRLYLRNQNLLAEVTQQTFDVMYRQNEVRN